MHKLFEEQLAEARDAEGQLDLGRLAELVGTAYVDAEQARVSSDRSLSAMAEELREANTLLLEAFNAVPEGFLLLDADRRYVLFNQRYVELYAVVADTIYVGGSFEASLRAALERGLVPAAIGREEEWFAERLARLDRDHSQMEQGIAGDRWVWVEERRTANGGSIGVQTEITELKRREEALQRRSEQLAEAQRLAKSGDWGLRLGAMEFWWSPQIYDLLHYDPATFTPRHEAVMAICVDDSAARVLEAHAGVLQTGAISTVDIKVRRGDGSIADMALTSWPVVKDDQVVGLAGNMQDISERKAAEEQLEKLAFYDPLTGLANRALFQRQFSNLFERCQTTGPHAALLLLDLDRFKEVNDSLGHTSGDELLTRIAHVIARILGREHYFYRLGGDEFAIVMERFDDRQAICRLADSIIAALSEPIRLDRGEVTIGTSIGIALMPYDGNSPTDLQKHADLALYGAKDAGRGCFRFFEPGMDSAAQHKIVVARQLRRAIAQDSGLAVHYQPLVSLATGTVTGYEALIRWTDPTLGPLSPAEFIPIAESSQLICDLGIWVLRRSAEQAKAWLDAGEAPREISVNVSAAQIWQTDFTADVAMVLAETGLPPHLLCLELTESLLADHAEGRVKAALTKLKSLGVTLALDDFGTAYSSLGYLTQLPFDRIKIDQIFVQSIETSARARNLLEGIIALGRGLGMTIVVEGVETSEQVAIAQGFGCDLLQGYVFARPSTAAVALSAARALESEPLDQRRIERLERSALFDTSDTLAA